MIAKLTEEVAVMKQSFADLRESVTTSNSDMTGTDAAADGNRRSQTAMIVHRTLYDNSKRKQNVVVSGLPETYNDRRAFLDLCEQHLDIRPVVADNGCVRIGSGRPDKPRLLLVRLRSETTAAALLTAARRLRHCSNPDVANRVFINPDLSKEAAHVAYERRQQRRARQMSAVSLAAAVQSNVVPRSLDDGSGVEPDDRDDSATTRLHAAVQQTSAADIMNSIQTLSPAADGRAADTGLSAITAAALVSDSVSPGDGRPR